MISLKELNQHNYPTTPEIDKNLLVLLDRINIIREALGTPLTVTSGLRSLEQQQRLIAIGKSTATHSRHLYGEAVDIGDSTGVLKAWVLDNVSLLESTGLWCEAFESTPTWVHFQIVPPTSGNRFFKP